MLDPEVARDLLDDVLGGLRVTEAEARLEGGRLGQATVRDGRLVDHRDVSWTRVHVRASKRSKAGWRFATASSTATDKDGVAALRAALLDAIDAAPLLPEGARLTRPEDLPEVLVTDGYDEGIALTGPAFRLHTLAETAFQAKRLGWAVDGRFTTTIGGMTFDGQPATFAVANTHGVFAHHVGTGAQLVLRAGGQASDLWRDLFFVEGHRRTQLEHAAGVARALEDVRRAVAHGTRQLAETRIDAVVFDVVAVARLIAVWGQALGAEDAGARVAAEALGVRADVTHGEHQVRPFDEHGVPRHPVDVVVAGRLADGYQADDHQWLFEGQGPRGLVVEGATATLDELLAGVERGLLVRNIVLDWRPGVSAGELSAPDGALRIVHGEIRGAVAPFSVPVDLAKLFKQIDGVGVSRRALGAVVPPVRVPVKALEW